MRNPTIRTWFECKFEPLKIKFKPFEGDSNQSITNLNYSNAKSKNSNEIWSIRMRIRTTLTQIWSFQKQFEPFKCKFESLKIKFKPFEGDSNHSITNLNHSNTNFNHSNGIRSIWMQIWASRTGLKHSNGNSNSNLSHSNGLEPLECKFKHFG